MRYLAKIWLGLFAAALLSSAADAASFSATLDRDSITMGEQATLSLRFDDLSSDGPPSLPAIPGLQFQYLGPSTSFQMVNGNTTSSVTYNFLVVAQHDGNYVIPAFQITLNGQQYTSTPLSLTVNKVESPSADAINSGNQVAFLKLVLPRKQIYLGETVIGTLELYLRDDVQNINGFSMTGSSTDGFTAGKLTEGRNQRQVQVGSRVYRVVPLSLPLTPLRAGQLNLGPFTASVNVILPGRNQNGDPFFRQFFNQGEQEQVSLATDTILVDSRPLPEAGRPANFSGAIGNFSMTVTAGPTNLTVGDPITVRAQITGRGSIESLSLPLPDTWHDFKAFPPTSKFEPADASGYQGTKTFEQIISPQSAEVRELPPFSFTFFNPDDGQYHTLSQPALPLTVQAATASALPALVAAKAAQTDNNAAPQDIVPVREDLGALATPTPPLLAQPVFLACQSVPVIAFLAALIWRKRTDLLANNPRLRRQRAVAQLTATGTADLQRHAAANKPDEFFAVLFRLLQEQLGERLDTPATAITEADVDRLARWGAPADTLDALRELFQYCNQARYAPVRGSSELNSLTAKFKQTVVALEGLKR